MNDHAPPLVMIEWEDTTCIAAWHDEAEVKEFAADSSWLTHNVGYVVHEDDACVVLAARRTVDGGHCGLLERIPTRAVVARHVLEAAPIASAAEGLRRFSADIEALYEKGQP